MGSLTADSFIRDRDMWMAPQPEPNQPPKRETAPMPVPTVGLGNNQVIIFTSSVHTNIRIYK